MRRAGAGGRQGGGGDGRRAHVRAHGGQRLGTGSIADREGAGRTEPPRRVMLPLDRAEVREQVLKVDVRQAVLFAFGLPGSGSSRSPPRHDHRLHQPFRHHRQRKRQPSTHPRAGINAKMPMDDTLFSRLRRVVKADVCGSSINTPYSAS